MSVILDFRVRDVFYYHINVRNGFLDVELVNTVYLFIFVAFICQKLFFNNGAWGHFGFTPLEKNAEIFATDTRAKYFLKGSKKSNQSSRHPSQKVVMKVRFFTLLSHTLMHDQHISEYGTGIININAQSYLMHDQHIPKYDRPTGITNILTQSYTHA